MSMEQGITMMMNQSLSVDFERDIDRVSVYPNPFTYFLSMEFRLRETGELILEIVNDNGQKVFRKEYGKFESGDHRIIINSYSEE